MIKNQFWMEQYIWKKFMCVWLLSVMCLAHEVSVKIVHVCTSFCTAITFPGIWGITMETSMKKIQSLVGKNDVAMLTLPLTESKNRGRRWRGCTQKVGAMADGRRIWSWGYNTPRRNAFFWNFGNTFSWIFKISYLFNKLHTFNYLNEAAALTRSPHISIC